jgi:hypothetical protein
MIQITPQMRVLVAIEPVDGRKGIDSLAQLCREKLAEDPFSGCVFVFRSRSGTAIRLLTYDGQGYWLLQKRLSKNRFRWWPESDQPAKASYVGQLDGIGVIPRIVVLAEIGGGVEDHVNPSKIISEIGYVADVPYDLASGSVAKFPPRFFPWT